MRAVRETDGGGGAENSPHPPEMLEIAEARAAIFFLDRDAVQAERAHLGPQIAREFIAAVDVVGTRRDAVTGEVAHRLAQHVDIRPKAEIEARPGIGDHAPPSIRHARLGALLEGGVYRLRFRLSAPRRAAD